MRTAQTIIAMGLGLALIPLGAASASDAGLQRAVEGGLNRALAAEGAAQGGDPTAVQDAYDAARDLQELIRASYPVSRTCVPLFTAATGLASALVREQEGFDRPSPSLRASARSRVASLQSDVSRARAACDGSSRASAVPRVPMRPANGEAFFGSIISRGPVGSVRGRILVGGKLWKDLPLRNRSLRFDAEGQYRRYDFTIEFLNADGAVVGRAEANDTWLLPASGKVAKPAAREDRSLAAQLETIARRAPGTVAIWSQDLRSGTFAGTNAGARFPAASTVKLGVLAGAIKRLGASPEASPLYYDLKAIANWSSNLAANRIVKRLGSGCSTARDQLANEGLRMLGAVSSTYTGCYIVGTELQPQMPSAPATASPPLNTQRYTTAQDLGRMMFALQASAVPTPGARGETGLSSKQARQIIGLLLSSQQTGENRSLVAAGAPTGTPIAQKNGWLGSARLSASIAYLPSGPVILTLAEYSGGGVSLATAQQLGADAMRASG